ncbi:GGDEF domain-containing protein [Agrobacterium sp. SORGH_AS 787]|uniref:GGDEF domain-containing protein n=1 Tax=Agrobacterium sp. SORGH_AS 787 TaxID=3041775 RepID=UPI0027848B5D|nr:diguanylate cyclase (GGDEF)-like protein [Rhizobium sp. SORGH_AS_0787]
MRKREPDDLYKALVAQLAYTVTPTTVMGFTLVVIGYFAATSLHDTGIFAAMVCGGLASFAKVCVMLCHRHWTNTGRPPSLAPKDWELAHAILTFLVAASVGAISALIFRSSDFSLHVLATALLFGYSAGVASRMSVRPLISAIAISIAAVPTTISAAFAGDTAHWLLATMFAVFLLAAMQSVWHVYRTASQQILLRLEMERLARVDPLTGLANRIALREGFARSPHTVGPMIAVHCLDLDGFKAINDRLGHSAGDDLLIAIGVRLRGLIVPHDIAARVGGDEFVVVQTQIQNTQDVEQTAHDVFQSLTTPFDIFDEAVRVGVSLGYTVRPAKDAEFSTMIRLADAASYRAKRNGGGVEREFPSFHQTSPVAAD